MGSFIIPVLCYRFCTGIKPDAVFSKHMQISEERLFISGKREISGRNRNADINTYHASVCEKLELTCVISALGKDNRTVGKRIGIHHGKAFVKIFHAFDQRYRPEDLPVSHRHSRFYMVKDRRPNKKSVLIRLIHFHIPAVQHQLGAFIDPLLDPFADSLLMGF